MENRGAEALLAGGAQHIGWQIYDPATSLFISEGTWSPLPSDIPSGGSAPVQIEVVLPPQNGPYRVYVSPVAETAGWSYARGERFLVADVIVRDARAELSSVRETTLGALRRANVRRALPRLFTDPFRAVWSNRRLIRSMVRRDILARYRGSFGDLLWTVLNPLLLMTTYFFVFGVVLRTRFGADSSRSGFVLYFLAGMLPWLAFSEAIGRAPSVIVDHRNFVKKLVFPLETLPVNLVSSGFVTEVFALVIFALFVLFARGGLPVTALWLPALVIPQLLLTAGLCWFLAALGVYVRDLGQVIGFVLTLWFFLTPICYPDTALPPHLLPILGKNPIYTLVSGYRSVFLESRPPEWHSLWKLWLLATAVAVFGFAWFHRLRRTFADVI